MVSVNNKEGIKISLESFDHVILNKAMSEIISNVKRTGAEIKGPVPLPTKIKKFTLIKGPHVDKDSREQFEIRSYKRLLIILPTVQTVDALMKLNVSSGVNIKIAINGSKK
jgi:small subunit ribosomal protein S10